MNIQTFQPPFVESLEIRTIIEDGDPLFVAADVAHNLGYRMASDMTRRLEQDDRGTRRMRTPSGEQEMTVITESGLYVAIMGSQIAAAKEFKRWVTREVLPSIHRTGGYTASPAFQVPQTLSEALRLAADLSDKVEAQAAQIEHQRPAVAFVEALVDTTSLTTLSDAAKEFGYGPKEFTAILVGRKILFRRTKSGPLIARQEHLDAGRFAVKVWMGNGYTKPNTHLTAKGLVWLKGIIPTATTDTFWDLEA